ncbi:MAG: DNA primase [Verrucomicrobiota bacterium]
MPIIARKTIEDIRLRVDLVDVVSPHVSLKRVGRNWKGLSPFTSEKTPSFFVHPDKGFYKCFSTGNTGDHFKFIQEVENVSFQEAIEILAKRFNISLEYESGGPSKEERSLKQELYSIHEQATYWFHQAFLAKNEEGAWVRNYWTEDRAFKSETAEIYRIGWAPKDPFALFLFLKSKGFSGEALQKSGLFYLKENQSQSTRARCRFAGRLMIPIRDNNARVIAFTARVTELTPEDDIAREAKYVNSPETPIFHKSSILFNLDSARLALKETDILYMVEGQLDAIRCVESGIANTVAPQGTSITEQQVSAIRKLTQKLTLVLDGDNAGQKAALRAIPIALKAGLEVSVVVLPEGADPDTIVKQQGPEQLARTFSETLSAMQFARDAMLSNTNATPADRQSALRSTFEMIKGVDSAILEQDYLDEVARLWGVAPDALHTDYHQYKKRQAHRSPRQAQDDANSVNLKDGVTSTLTRVESQLLWLVLRYENFAEFIAEHVDISWIDGDSVASEMLRRVLSEISHGIWTGANSINALLENEPEQNLIYELQLIEMPLEEPEKVIKSAINNLYQNMVQGRLQRINEQILTVAADSDEAFKLSKERIELRKARATPLLPL